MFTASVRWSNGCVALASLLALVVLGAVMARAEVLPEGEWYYEGETPYEGELPPEGEGEPPFQSHPADSNGDGRMTMSEAIGYLACWQQGSCLMSYAIRAAYLWQNGEGYAYDASLDPPMCWELPEPAEGEVVYSLMLGLGAVSPEYVHGSITPDPAPDAMCPPLEGQPWCGLYPEGTSVWLTPVPHPGYVFSHWTGDLSGMQVPALVVMNDDKHVLAEFVVLGEGEGEVPMEGEYPADTLLLPGDVPLVLVRIPAGSFQMGSPDTERSRWSDEGPVHTVMIDYDFYMGKYEVTQAQWLAVMGSSPGGYAWDYGQGDTYPAYYVSWNDAQNFITALNTHITNTGQGPATVRLPSEAEWEYACRGGTQTRFYFGDSLSVDDYCEDDGTRSQYMWYCGNNPDYGEPGYGSKPVGGKLANAFGLHDMSGNVWEWCEDDWHGSYTGAPSNGSAWIDAPRGSYRVVRGGSWCSHAQFCRSADRDGGWPAYRRYSRFGFRLVR